MSKIKERYEIVHGRGPYACCGTAFYWDHKPDRNEVLKAKHAIYDNDFKAEDGTPMKCQSCGRDISVNEVYPIGGFV